jgi:hypothetical protein
VTGAKFSGGDPNTIGKTKSTAAQPLNSASISIIVSNLLYQKSSILGNGGAAAYLSSYLSPIPDAVWEVR